MAEVKYSYCLDENGRLVHIGSLTDATRHSHEWYCLQCGQEMVPNLCSIRKPYFSHKANTACNRESYLHKLAKKRIREKFMTEESFPIVFKRDIPCKEHARCPYYSEFRCKEIREKPCNLRKWEDKLIYDTCEEEKEYHRFRPDLLLTNSYKEYKPTFIEIYKTHKSDETKLSSKNPIIETTQIKSEQDIDDILEKGFVEGENCETHNFNPEFPLVRKTDIPIERFIMQESGKASVIYAFEHLIHCDEVFEMCNPRSYAELNIVSQVYCDSQSITLTSYEKGLVYLMKKGLPIKNCILCKNNKYNYYHNGHICIKYKWLGLRTPYPGQLRAQTCPYFEIKQELMEYPMTRLEKEVFEVPRDE